MKKKLHKVTCEYELDQCLLSLVKLAKSKTKVKLFNVWFPTSNFSKIFLSNIPNVFKENNIDQQQNLHVSVYIEEGLNDE